MATPARGLASRTTLVRNQRASAWPESRSSVIGASNTELHARALVAVNVGHVPCHLIVQSPGRTVLLILEESSNHVESMDSNYFKFSSPWHGDSKFQCDCEITC
jgi:hypothetical protein